MKVSSCDARGDGNDQTCRPVSLSVVGRCDFENVICIGGSALRQDDSRDAPLSVGLNPLKDCDPSSVGSGNNLRKRTFGEAVNDKLPMASYNSTFLSGLFAEIAEANKTADEGKVSEKRSSFPSEELPSSKRSRLSLTKSISRCPKSFANLQTTSCSSPTSCREPLKHQDSLCYQLHCVSSGSSTGSNTVNVTADVVGKLAFPHLPATVSDNSCSQIVASLTRRNSGQLLPESETDLKESYGWFVSFEDDEETVSHSEAELYSRHSSCSDLAFSAVTAPKQNSSLEAEVEWAKAADTVDDVLGDFF